MKKEVWQITHNYLHIYIFFSNDKTLFILTGNNLKSKMADRLECLFKVTEVRVISKFKIEFKSFV